MKSLMFSALSILFICLVFASCSSNKTVEIINPTEEDIVVVIDDRSIGIMHGGSRLETLSAGKHNVGIEGSPTEVVDISGGPSLILNPTHARFIKETIYFSTASDLPIQTAQDSLEVDGYAVVGPYKDLGTGMLITGKWDYGPLDRVDEEIQMYGSKGSNSSTTRTKVHSGQAFTASREAEYRKLIKEYEEKGLDGDLLKGLLGLTDEQYDRIVK